jgi:hypothetical protein
MEYALVIDSNDAASMVVSKLTFAFLSKFAGQVLVALYFGENPLLFHHIHQRDCARLTLNG